MLKTPEALLLGSCLAGLGFNAKLAHQLRPDLAAPTALTQGQQEKLEELASASLFGQFRSSMSDFLWLKADKYLHKGIDMRGLTPEERRSETAEQVGHGTGHAADGNREHGSETTLVPSARTDWRGTFGDIEREIKPYADMRAHEHRDPKETLPLFRLMTWSNPQFVLGYTTGAAMMARNAAGHAEALRFLEEGKRNNPDSIQIETAFAFLLMKGPHQGKPDLASACQHAEQALAHAHAKDPQTLTEDEKEAWQEAVRWRVLAYRDLGKKAQAIQAAQEGLRAFPEDVTCVRLLKEEGLYPSK